MAPKITCLGIVLMCMVLITVEKTNSTKTTYKKPILGKRYTLQKKDRYLEHSANELNDITTETIMQSEMTATAQMGGATAFAGSSEQAGADFKSVESVNVCDTKVSKNERVALMSLENNVDDDDVIEQDLQFLQHHSSEDITASTTIPENRTDRTNNTRYQATLDKLPRRILSNDEINSNEPIPCTCGVFLSSQFKRGANEQPQSDPVIVNELDRLYPCNIMGVKLCQIKCLETMVQHLPNSANILCATLGRDCRKERAYLFVKNCRNQWHETNLAAGREYCCRNGKSYPCPLI